MYMNAYVYLHIYLYTLLCVLFITSLFVNYMIIMIVYDYYQHDRL